MTPDALIVSHLALVHRLAWQLVGRCGTLTRDDLVSAGMLGLVHAARAYDGSRGASFLTFASPRIRGAMLDDVRAHEGARHVLRARLRRMRRAADVVSQRTQAPPTARAIATEAGLRLDQVWDAYAGSVARAPVTLGESLDVLADDDAADTALLRDDQRRVLRDALAKISPRQRAVVEAHYFEHLTLTEISQRLDCSLSNVCLLHTHALARLRVLLAPQRDAASLAGMPPTPRVIVPAALSDRVVMVRPNDLQHHPQNPNIGNVDAIAASIRADGFYGTLVVQRRTKYVLVGNHRLKAAKLLHMPRVPVAYVDVDDARALRILLSDNRTAELAHRDPAAVLAILDEIGTSAETLAGVGFSLDDVEELRRVTQRSGEAAARTSVGRATPHFDVLVSCESEREQRALFERLQTEGRTCRLLL